MSNSVTWEMNLPLDLDASQPSSSSDVSRCTSALSVQFPQKSFLHPSCASCRRQSDGQKDSSPSSWPSGPQTIAGVTSPARTMCCLDSAPTGSWALNPETAQIHLDIKVLWTEGTISLVPLRLRVSASWKTAQQQNRLHCWFIQVLCSATGFNVKDPITSKVFVSALFYEAW